MRLVQSFAMEPSSSLAIEQPSDRELEELCNVSNN